MSHGYKDGSMARCITLNNDLDNHKATGREAQRRVVWGSRVCRCTRQKKGLKGFNKARGWGGAERQPQGIIGDSPILGPCRTLLVEVTPLF